MRYGQTLRHAGAWLAAAALLGACDAPTEPGTSAAPAGPSMLITPACAGTAQAHAAQSITAAQTWTRDGSPHRVTGTVVVESAARLTIAPGAVVCFDPGAVLQARNGGRIHARGRDTARIVLTAHDPAQGWGGIELSGAPAGPTYLTNVRIELVNVDRAGITTRDQHAAYVDSAVIRRSGYGAYFAAPGSRFIRSTVDSTVSRTYASLYLGAGSFEHSVVRGAPNVGMIVSGPNVLLLGGRIEGSGGAGLWVFADSLNGYSRAVRITGGQSYPAELPLSAFVRLYPTPALQDSLLGNAQAAPHVFGGTLRTTLTAGPRLPLLVQGDITADAGGAIVAQPGARIVFGRGGGIVGQNGGRLVSRGTAANPVVLTAEDPAAGWRGLRFWGYTAATSYLTNTRVEHTGPWNGAVTAYENHRVIVDSAVIRHAAYAASLYAPNSRLVRTRVDTMLNSDYPAVELATSARVESVLIRGSAGIGIEIYSPDAVVASCEIRDGEEEGIVLYVPVTIRNCNLVDNLGAGMRDGSSTGANVSGNWWGSPDGPNGAGGDGVIGPLVVSPWRTTPYVLPYVP